MNNKFWKQKNVLITGFEGFLGSNLTKSLIHSGANIYGLDIKVRRNETLLTVPDYRRIKIIKASVTNYNLIKNIVIKKRINIIFHLAAETLVGNCFNHPRKALSTNIEGTWNILEACRGLKTIQAIVIASSDKAYGSHKKLPYREDAPLIGNHPYDVSKSCADLIAFTYFHSYGLPVAITRCGNIYGPGDFNFSRIIPDAIRCALKGKTLYIRSDGRFTRDYVFVDDIIKGYTMLAEKLRSLKLDGEAFNFSCEDPVMVIKLADQIFKAAGKKPNYRILNKAKYEIRDQYLSSAKARRKIGWRPKYSLEAGLKKTTQWYLSKMGL